MSMAYLYGLTQASAITLAPGASKSLTQYILAAPEECPPVLEPCGPASPASPQDPASPQSPCSPSSPSSV